MGSPSTFDIDALLEPISAEAPCGSDATTDTDVGLNELFEIEELRASISEPRDWDGVKQRCLQCLAEQSKDVRVLSFLLEAAIHVDGLAGFRDGLILARRFVETYWGQLFPQPDASEGETADATFRALERMIAGPLVKALRDVPLTEGDEFGPYSLVQYAPLREFESKPELKEQRLASGWISQDMFDSAVADTSTDFYAKLMSDLRESLTAQQELQAALEAACEAEDDAVMTPSTRGVRVLLEEMEAAIKHAAGHKLPQDAEAGDSGESEDGDAAAAAPAQSDQIDTREKALRKILEIAEFFERTEPHSPVPVQLRQAERWARMSLRDLWKELIRNSDARTSVLRQVGFERPGDEE